MNERSPGWRANRRRLLQAAALLPVAPGHAPEPPPLDVLAEIGEEPDRVWVGPSFWANRLQDWRLRGGRVECVRAEAAWPMRTLHLLTRALAPRDGSLEVAVRLGRLDEGAAAPDAAAGFLVGAGGAGMEYRAAALIHHRPGPGGGLFAGVDVAGRCFFRSFEGPAPAQPLPPAAPLPDAIDLHLAGERRDGRTRLLLVARDAGTGRELSRAEHAAAEPLAGGLALVSHPGSGPDGARFWFLRWQVRGSTLQAHDERAWGPILSTLYTVHDGTLKLTAQMAPLGASRREARLEVRPGGTWSEAARASIDPSGWTARFRVEKWDASRDTPYRVVYQPRRGERHTWPGVIRRDPRARRTLVLASLSCVQQIDGNLNAPAYAWKERVWFPHADLVRNLARHRADLYFFAGDQIYEGNPTRPIRQPADEAELDYLYKWYLWCWSFGELVRDAPCVVIPDDHDVYQGNVWGDGGRSAAPGDPGGQKGGYGMPPVWLNTMQRTQTSHLPDPVDPAPAARGIEVYFTTLVWGGVGFAILEDRKFKSSPSLVKAEMTPDSHIIERDYDTRKADLPGATLLGDRQERFLRRFAGDWRGHVMKAVLSQTIFCNLQISSRGVTTGQLDRDLDSGGWPQTPRHRALREMRRGFMLHLAGDQHLASVVHHGVDEFEDAPWSLCSPAVANLYPRFWNPSYPPLEPRAPGAPSFTGRYRDGFHNRITVHAVANPAENPAPGQFPPPVELHRKATGYAMVRFDKEARTITLEVWPRYADPHDPATGGQYAGWPVTLRQTDNYARKPAAWLPEIHVRGARDPVVTVLEEPSGDLVYSLRIRGAVFRPWVFAPGAYAVRVIDPEGGRERTLPGLAATVEPMGEVRVSL